MKILSGKMHPKELWVAIDGVLYKRNSLEPVKEVSDYLSALSCPVCAVSEKPYYVKKVFEDFPMLERVAIIEMPLVEFLKGRGDITYVDAVMPTLRKTSRANIPSYHINSILTGGKER